MRVYLFTYNFEPSTWWQTNGLQSFDPYSKDAFERNSDPVKAAHVALAKLGLRSKVCPLFSRHLYMESRYSSRYEGFIYTFPTKRVSILLVLEPEDFQNREVAIL